MFLSHHPTFFRPFAHSAYGCRRPQLYVYRVTNDEEEESSKKTTNDKVEKPTQITPTTSVGASPEPKSEENHDSAATLSVVYLNRSARLIDEEAAFTLQVDLPGVKRDSVTVEVDDEAIQIKAERKHVNMTAPQTFHQQFSIDTSRVRVSEIKAGLADGVLSVHIPKNVQPSVEPFSLQVTQGYAPDGELVAEKENFTYSLDLPGVRNEDVTVEYRPEKLVVTGERKQGGAAISKTVRVINADPRKLDVTKTQAYLADGVLQILVPLKNGACSSRKVVVESGSLMIEAEKRSTKTSVLPPEIETSEQLKKSKSSDAPLKSDACSTKSDEVSVETVNENDEEDSPPKKPKAE